MAEFDQGVDTAESPTAPTDQSATTSAGTLNTDQAQNGQPQNQPFHLHPAWQQREQVWGRRFQQQEDRLKQLEQRRDQPGQPASDEERQLKEARDAFYGKVAPELKDLPQAVSEFRQERFYSRGDAMISRFASDHGLNAKEIENAFAEVVKSDPALLQRVEKGDIQLVAQYLRGLQPVVASLKQQGQQAQREGVANVAQTKQNMLRSVPHRQAGSQSGAVAPKPLTGDFRKDMTAMNNEADAMLRALNKG